MMGFLSITQWISGMHINTIEGVKVKEADNQTKKVIQRKKETTRKVYIYLRGVLKN